MFCTKLNEYAFMFMGDVNKKINTGFIIYLPSFRNNLAG